MYTDLIRAAYPDLSSSYRKIADFLINHYRDAAFMTASEIGRKTGTDTAQVVRLAQRLGYPGFPELVAEIQERVKRDLQRVYEPAEEDRQPAAVVYRALTQDRNNLEQMRLHFDPEAIERVVHLIHTARRIFMFGESNANFLAEAFAHRLLALGIDAHLISGETATQATTLAIASRDDLFIGLGMTAMSPNIAVFLKMARSIGAHTLGLVGTMTNPVASVAEHVLLAPIQTVGLLPSLTAFAALLHGLIQAVAALRGYDMADWAMRTGHYLEEYARALRAQLPSSEEVLRSYSGSGQSPDQPGPTTDAA